MSSEAYHPTEDEMDLLFPEPPRPGRLPTPEQKPMTDFERRMMESRIRRSVPTCFKMDRTWANILLAMIADGGKHILLDADFLSRHNIQFQFDDPKITPDLLSCWGFIAPDRCGQAGGWRVTSKGKEWAFGRKKVRPTVAKDAPPCSGVYLWGRPVGIKEVMEDDNPDV